MPLGETPSSVVENKDRFDTLPRPNAGEILKNKLGAEARQEMPKILNDYGKRYREVFDALKHDKRDQLVDNMPSSLRILAQQVRENDDGIRCLIAADDHIVSTFRQQILTEIDRPNQDKAKRDRLVLNLIDAFKEAGIIDFSLMNELLFRQLNDKNQALLSGYRDLVPGSDTSKRIQEGLSFINGGPRTELVREGTPQEEVLKMYLDGIRLGNITIDIEVQRKLTSGQIKTAEDFGRETFRSFQSFLATSSVGLEVDKFCPNQAFYTKLCQGLGIDQLQISVGEARLELQEKYIQEIANAATSQRPVIQIDADTRHLHGTFSQFAGVPIDLLNRGMNFAGRLVPEPGHIIGADVGDAVNVGLKLYLGVAGFLNFAALGTGAFDHFRKGLISLKSGDVSGATNEITGIFKDMYQAIPGPLGTGALLLAAGASRFTSPQEAETWVRNVLAKAGTEIQLRTGMDILGMGKDVATSFMNGFGEYFKMGKAGVLKALDGGWSMIRDVTSPTYLAFRRWAVNEGYNMDDLHPHFACQYELMHVVENHFSRENIGVKELEFTFNNKEFNRLLTAYSKDLKSGKDTLPEIDYQSLVDAGIIKSLPTKGGKLTLPTELSEKIKKQASWLIDHNSIFEAPFIAS